MSKNYIEAPCYEYPSGTSIFIGGGISNCPDWQTPVCKQLEDTNLVLFNPRRKNFDITDLKQSDIQIEWEHYFLNKADLLLFWFPAGQSVCPITLFEYGYWLAKGKKIFLGVESGYPREFDLLKQTQLVVGKGQTTIFNNLDDLVSAVKEFVK